MFHCTPPITHAKHLMALRALLEVSRPGLLEVLWLVFCGCLISSLYPVDFGLRGSRTKRSETWLKNVLGWLQVLSRAPQALHLTAFLLRVTGPANVRTPGMPRCRVAAGTLRINVASHDLYSLQECGIN